MDAAMENLKPGDVVSVVIRSLISYGAFANIKDPQTGSLTGGSVSLWLFRHNLIACIMQMQYEVSRLHTIHQVR